jgi:predicted Zn-dependent protease
LTNLEVLPQDIPVRELVGIMAGFTRALGVRCAYCHVGEASMPLGEYDFASDDRPTKRKARQMLEMVGQINDVHLAGLEERSQPAVSVQCITCHRGKPRPRMLHDVLIEAYEAGSIDSTLTTYETLRAEEYGGFSYDFGEVPLADVGATLAARSEVADAIRVHELNARMNPESTFAWSSLAGTLVAAADTAGAIRAFEWALRADPENPVAAQRIRQLRGR